MPFRYLNKKSRFELMKARYSIPLFIFIFGCMLSLYIGHSIHKNEIRARDAALFFSAKEYSKQFELNLLNNILRIQSLVDVYGATTTKVVNNKQSVDELLRNSFFQRISIFKKTGINQNDGLPILKRIAYIKSDLDHLPKPAPLFITSPHFRKKIKTMEKKAEPSGFTLIQNDKGFFVVLIWKIPEQLGQYAMFSAPLESIFSAIPITSEYKIVIKDPDTSLSLNISWNQKAEMEVSSGNAMDAQTANTERLLIENSVMNYSSLHVTWYGNIDRSVSHLTLIVIATGVLISALFALLLRFILNQNSLVANLVVKRTADLEVALNEATVANLAKSRFLGNMSHELRTPLNLILGMLDLVDEKNKNSKVSEYLKAIRVSGDHLLSLISDLLDMAQKDSGELKIQNLPIRFPQFVEEVGQLIGSDARKKNLDFYMDIAPDIPESVRGDPARLRQILMNLLRNSIKYTVKGSIELHVYKLDPSPATPGKITLRIEVIDTGVGIPKAKQTQIFDRFLQLDSSMVLSQGGVGLGLSIVKDLVEMMNGHIAVESELGVGSTFSIDLDFEVMDPSPWTNIYRKKVYTDMRVAIISDHSVFVQNMQNALGCALIRSENFNTDRIQNRPLESWTSGFTHFVIDQNTKYEISNFLAEGFPFPIILVGNEKKMAYKPQSAKFWFIDGCPMLTSSMLTAFGISRIEPRNVVSTTTAAIQNPPAIATQKRNLSVLIADDDEGNRQLFQAYFADLGWKLSFTENGKEALEKYKDAQPDVLIADLRMPVMDGFELTDQVRHFESIQKIKKVPIILVTADALDQTAEDSRLHGVTSFLTKPIRKSKIVNTVLSVLDQQNTP